ncbi:MAG TPA: RnfABCDGE type electron transport complex subunit D [Pseudomonadales bacterium]
MRPFVHSPRSTRAVQRLIVLASLPAALVGTWNLGWQTLIAIGNGRLDAVPEWMGLLAAAADPTAAAESFLLASAMGLGAVLPLLAVALSTAAFWAFVFARTRRRKVDAGWFLCAWLFVWLAPPSTTLGVAALAVSFGCVVGLHIFGGTGRYLVSPALLAALFVHFGYPEFLASPLPVPSDIASDWTLVAAGGSDLPSLTGALLGTVPGGIGTGSALACLLGGGVLIATGVASWRVPAGALAGLGVGAMLLGWTADDPLALLGGYWHLLVGSFAFALAFIAADPTPAPLLAGTRWIYGALFGLLTVIIRVLDPTHPEGSLFALLLAGLAVPLADHLALRRYRRDVQP